MSDFISGFWSFYVAGLTLVSIVACALLLFSMSKRKVAADPDKTGHVWDEDLDEYNNPLPRWWIWLFVVTIVFSFAYLWFYPGLGSWSGAYKWSSTGQYEFAGADLKALARSPEALVVGEKLFMTYCTQCHAADARGGRGFPNLTDNDWLYGGEPETIKATILNGRNGMMPPMGQAVGDAEAIKDTANYVRSLSGLQHDAARAERGKAKFQTICAACHGPEGKGNPMIGAPNLTDKVWLYGSSEATIIETITKGRTNKMPAHKEFLGEPRVHLLAAYVYSLSHRNEPAPRTAEQSVLRASATR
jgi:cytochrome c oxidase cbb3-type subunit 3